MAVYEVVADLPLPPTNTSTSTIDAGATRVVDADGDPVDWPTLRNFLFYNNRGTREASSEAWWQTPESAVLDMFVGEPGVPECPVGSVGVSKHDCLRHAYAVGALPTVGFNMLNGTYPSDQRHFFEQIYREQLQAGKERGELQVCTVIDPGGVSRTIYT
jgi:hypothetical protein